MDAQTDRRRHRREGWNSDLDADVDICNSWLSKENIKVSNTFCKNQTKYRDCNWKPHKSGDYITQLLLWFMICNAAHRVLRELYKLEGLILIRHLYLGIKTDILKLF